MSDAPPVMSVPFLDLKAQQKRIAEDLRRRLDAVLAHCQFVLGPEVRELEAALAAFCGAKHCVGVSSGTDALQIALMAEEIGRGDAVFLPAFTYTATAEVPLLLGATPLRDKARTAALLERVYGIFPKLKERRTQRAGTMSGGERQMLAVGRALMRDPKLLMLDEPSLGLAPIIVADIFRTIGELRTSGVSVLLVEQNAQAALKIADRAYVMELGEFVLQGTAKDVAGDARVAASYLGLG